STTRRAWASSASRCTRTRTTARRTSARSGRETSWAFRRSTGHEPLRRAIVLLAFLLLATPGAGATCVSLGCAQWADRDGDGAPDWLLVGIVTPSETGGVGVLVNGTHDAEVQGYAGTPEGVDPGYLVAFDPTNGGRL